MTKFAYKEYPTPTALGRSIMVVPRASAVVPGQADAEPIVIHANHRDMVKFDSQEDVGYETVSEHIQIMIKSAPEKIQSRWEEEERVEQARDKSLSNSFALPLNLSEVTEIQTFVGRTEELKRLHQILEKRSGRRTAIVHGLGGMGKTQLAVEYLKTYKSAYTAMVWLNARDEETLRQSFARVAKWITRQHPQATYVRSAVDGQDLNDIIEAVKRWFDQPKNDGWLLVYDNYDDPKLNKTHQRDETTKSATGHGLGAGIVTEMSGKAYDIRPYFPNSYQGAILVTTRSSTVKLGESIRLDKLGKDDGLRILASTSGRSNLQDDKAAVEVAKILDGLPLALSTAGAYLCEVPTTWTKYLTLYQESWLRLQQATPQLLEYEYAMYSTWNISFTHIEEQDSTAAKLLTLWAYFDKDDLWYELLRKTHPAIPGWLQDVTEDQITFEQSMRVLCQHGLVDADPATRECGTQSRGYSVHGCVHSWIQHVLNHPPNLQLARTAILCVAEHVPDTTEPEFWWVQRRLLQHSDHSLRLVESKDNVEDEAWIFGSLANLYYYQGRLGEAEAMYQRALQGYQKALGDNSVRTYPPALITLENIGDLLREQGKAEAARGYYTRAEYGVAIVHGAGSSRHADIVAKLQSVG
ncbi:hypothetical protein KVR01_001954 [Diaporthe batatas]|uniref:uncharacterized protein n=1 Tax=Diaporthe batatas TaxID=748121 RepID=UPI001D0593B2|nr:uncharacterized protein KVR01_001954 [Diaporthe batatas]KAG8169205.1 hypothetical protein KVR01_001954 [Diaporthe batatas]